MLFSESDIQIFDAFLELSSKLHTKNLSDVPISKIAKQIDISRQALYQSHFHNMNELLNALHIYVDQDIKRQVIHLLKSQQSTSNLSEILITSVANSIYQKRQIFQILYTNNDPLLTRFLEDNYSVILESLFHPIKNNGVVISPEYQSKYIIHSFIGLMSIWMNQENPEPPQIYINKMLYLLDTPLKYLVTPEYI